MENDTVSSETPQDQPFGNVSGERSEKPVRVRKTDEAYIVEELKGGEWQYLSQINKVSEPDWVDRAAELAEQEGWIVDKAGLREAALALSSADSSGSDKEPLPGWNQFKKRLSDPSEGSGEQPTSVERELKLKIVDMVNQFDEPCRRQDNTHISDYDGLDDAIYKLVAEERRQAKIELLERLEALNKKPGVGKLHIAAFCQVERRENNE